MADVVRISPSQINAYRDCERKWYFRSVLGIEAPAKPSAEQGTRVHRILEDYYYGVEIPITPDGDIARLALPHLPTPSQTPWVQWLECDLDLPQKGYDLHAIADLIDLSVQTVYDHKTSKDPRRWGLKEAELRYDAQAMINAGAGMRAFGWTSVRLQWTYIPTQSGRAYPVTTVVDGPWVAERIAELRPTCEAIVRSRAIPDIELTQPNSRACGKYGGCVYANICSFAQAHPLAVAISEGDNLLQLNQRKKENNMPGIDPAVLARIAQLTGQQPVAATPPAAPAAPVAPPPPAPVAPTPPPAASPEGDALAAVLARLRGNTAAPAAIAPPPPAPVVPPPAPESPPPPPAPVAAPAAPAPAPATNGAGYTLYINCLPVGEEYYLADRLIQSAAASAAHANGVSHYIEIEFAKGRAAIAHQLEKLLQGWTYNLVVLGGGREREDSLHTLRVMAARVVVAVT